MTDIYFISIQIPLTEILERSQYNFTYFVSQVLAFLSAQLCPLCGQNHSPSIHDFRPRILLTKVFVEFKFTILRIICHDCKVLRKQTGEAIQYTLTILPPFIGPYARIALRTLFKAFSCLSKGAPFDDVAGWISKTGDTRPFNRYLSRFLNRTPAWILRLCQWLIQSGVMLPSPELSKLGEKKQDMTDLWNIFTILAKLFCQYHEKSNSDSIILLDFQTIFIHARLSYSGMDLGP